MRLNNAEFRAMNSWGRRQLQHWVEFTLFKHLGLAECTGKDIVEIGCGSGYGARLLQALRPSSYVGLDVMPEQVERAQRLSLPNTRFLVGDATHLDALPAACADCVVLFGILHHVEAWQQAISEIRRILRAKGLLFVEEPEDWILQRWDRVFRWHHPHQGFNLERLESELDSEGLVLEAHWKIPRVFGWYRARRQTSCST